MQEKHKYGLCAAAGAITLAIVGLLPSPNYSGQLGALRWLMPSQFVPGAPLSEEVLAAERRSC
jgi:hypothetical protein